MRTLTAGDLLMVAVIFTVLTVMFGSWALLIAAQ